MYFGILHYTRSREDFKKWGADSVPVYNYNFEGQQKGGPRSILWMPHRGLRGLGSLVRLGAWTGPPAQMSTVSTDFLKSCSQGEQ